MEIFKEIKCGEMVYKKDCAMKNKPNLQVIIIINYYFFLKMKFLSTIPFVILIGLVCLIQTTMSQSCLEYLNPIYRFETKFVDCPMVSSKYKRDKRQETPTDMFTINFQCLIDNKTLCDKVNNVLITAGKFI